MEYGIGNRDDLSGILEINKQLNNTNDPSFTIDKAEKVWDIIENKNVKYFLPSCFFVVHLSVQTNNKLPMKTRCLLLIMSIFMMCACSEAPEEKGTGYLTLNINQSTGLKADIEFDDFILCINNGRTDVIKRRISELSGEIPLPAGVYTIEAYSMDFSDPKFEIPFYSGKTTVEIEAGETKVASLICSQGNAGIKVVWSDEFPILYSTYHAQIDCNEGYLHFSPTEARTGYFLPGTVSIIIRADGFAINGGTMMLAARDMVTATLRPKNESNSLGNFTIDITIDKLVNEREVTVIVDPDNPLNNETSPYSIAQAIERQDESGVWITGYIVGAKPSSGYDFVDSENWQSTNIVLADNIDETDSYKVIFVELGATTTQYRINLNLLDNADVLHRKVLLKGNLLAYQSRAGLRNLTGGFSFIE